MLQNILHVLFCSILPGASWAVISFLPLYGPLLFLSFWDHLHNILITLLSFSKVLNPVLQGNALISLNCFLKSICYTFLS